MAKPTYWELLRHPNWQRKRLEVLQREDFTCQRCGDKSTTLHVHHSYYEKGKAPWEYPEASLKVVCESCHEYAQSVMTELQRQIGSLEVWEVDTVHGCAVAIGLKSRNVSEKVVVYSEAFAEGLVAPFSRNARTLMALCNSDREISIMTLYTFAVTGDQITDEWIAANKEPEAV